MKFAQYLHEELIFLDIPSKTKDEATLFLSNAMCEYYQISASDRIICYVRQREAVKSTGIGKGLAIAHAREETMDKLYVAFARSDKGIEWDSVDKELVHYIFFIVGPTKLESDYLEILSDISRIMLRHDVREGIHNAKSPIEVINIIKNSGVRHKHRE
jgi:PTS system fructose-specific IIA component/PTS system nitrogen regulatory IIA component